jgi:DNA-binding SARP family transcriptional activator/TolB-like protein
MIRLRTLGTTELLGSDGHPIQSIQAQPKRLALLIYLAAVRGSYHRRDRLVGLFWPELDQEHARAALRKAIHFLRRSLGDGVLLGRGDEELGIEHTRLWCDVAALDDALQSGEHERALELSGGEFATGLYVAGVPELEHWLEQERARLSSAVARAAWAVAEREEEQGNGVAASRAAVSAAALTPHSESAHRRLIDLLHRLGDRSGALDTHAAFVQRLRRELDVEPSAETLDLVDRLRAADSVPRHPLAEGGVSRERKIVDRARAGHTEARFPPGDPLPSGDRDDSEDDPPHGGATSPCQPPSTRQRARSTRPAVAAVSLALLVLIALLTGVRRQNTLPVTEEIAAGSLAVAPFRVGGADPALAYLREGMVDLLSTLLTGEGGPRAADPRVVLNAWRSSVGDTRELTPGAARQVGATLGVDQILTGEVIGTPARLVVSASIMTVHDGQVRVRATVEGPSDSLTTMVDRLVAVLLSRHAGEGDHRVAQLTSTSLPALRAYLDGQAAHRAGHYVDALRHFERAIELDSTFALAGIGLYRAAGWVGGTEHARSRGPRIAWAARDRLSGRDRILFAALVGPGYPGASAAIERSDALEEALRAAPAESDLWYELGDHLFHYGHLIGRRNSVADAERSFRRALELNPTDASTIQHLVQLTARVGDTSSVLALGDRYLALDSVGATADFLRWRMAVATGDSAELRRIRSQFDSISTAALRWIGVTSQDEGIAAEDARAAVQIRIGRAGTRDERLERLRGLHALELNQGRPGAALVVTHYLAELENLPRGHLRQRVLDALFSDGDHAAAAEAADRLMAFTTQPIADSPEARRPQYEDLCVHAQWRLRAGDASGVPEAIDKLRNSSPAWDSERTVQRNTVCSAILEAELTALQRSPHAATTLARLDSLMLTSPSTGPTDHGNLDYGNLVVARLREAEGDLPGALAAARRRIYFLGWHPFASTYLREEGRLAAATGDVAGATDAYQRFLALRGDTEPHLVSEVRIVRDELQRMRARGAP